MGESGFDSLAEGQFTPVQRSLVIGFNEAGLDPVDNITAITWGQDPAEWKWFAGAVLR